MALYLAGGVIGGLGDYFFEGTSPACYLEGPSVWLGLTVFVAP